MPPATTYDSDNTMRKEQRMKSISIVSTLLLAVVVSTGAQAAENRFSVPKSGSNADTSMVNHIDVSRAFDNENLSAGDLQ